MSSVKTEMKEWLVKYKSNSVKPASYDRLVTSYDQLVKYPIADLDLGILTEDDIQDYVNQLVADGYALSTIRKQIHLVNEFTRHAFKKKMLSVPIHEDVKLPTESTVKKHRREVVAYTRSEQKALRNVLYRGDSPAYYVALIMMETGARVGEALSLYWSDIDWRRRSVHIGKTIVRLGNSRKSYIQDEPKSFSSIRTIALSTDAFELLSRMRDLDDSGSDLIFHDKKGKALTYECLRWWIRRACDEAGVPYYGQHVFRHTFATNCYERGCDVKLLSKFLGHSDVTITYNIYIHLYGDALEEMRAVLG